MFYLVWYCSLTTGGWGVVLLNRQNPLSMTNFFCWWSFNFNELFQLSHDYETENVYHRQNFGNIYLKAIRDTFSNMWSAMKGVMGWGMKESARIWFFGGEVQSWSPTKNTLRSVLGLVTVIILKRVLERVVAFKTINIQHVRLEMEKRWQNLWWFSIYVRLSIHFKVRSV